MKPLFEIANKLNTVVFSFSYRCLALKGEYHHGQHGLEVQVAEEIWIKLKQNYNLIQIETGCFYCGWNGRKRSVKAEKRQRERIM